MQKRFPVSVVDIMDIVGKMYKKYADDDFAEFIIKVPGAYAYVGSGNPDKPETTVAHHDSKFDVDEQNKCYNIYLEPNLYAKDKIDLESIDKSLLSSLIDSGLQLANLKYAEARLQGKINPCRVHILESQTQLLYYDKMRIIARKNEGSFRPVHFLKNEEYKKLFLPFCKN